MTNAHSSPSTPPCIPLINFSSFHDPKATIQDQVVVAKEILEAFKTNGFVYLDHIPISPQLVSEAFEWSTRFFDLPIHVKQQALHPSDGSSHRGYSPIGLEKVKPVQTSDPTTDDQRKISGIDHKETFDLGKSRGIPYNIWLPTETEERHALTGFRDFFQEFYEQCDRLAMKILRAISIGLMGVDNADYLEKFHQESNHQIRLAHYPPIEDRELIDRVRQRFGSHTDFGSITILFQDQVGGLEVENPVEPGKFLRVKPIDGTVVVNIGDLLMRWSNDTLRSTLHRVGPPDVIGLLPSRYSIPYFCGPDPKALIHCLPGTTSEPKYEPIYADDYLKMRMRASY